MAIRDYSTVPTPEDVVEAFSDFLEERAAAGVLLAKATEVSFTDGIVTVEFNPGAVVPDPAALMSLSPYENHAQFAGMPIVFRNEEGRWLRQVVDRVSTCLVDGTDLGSLSKAELYKIGTGHDLPDDE